MYDEAEKRALRATAQQRSGSYPGRAAQEEYGFKVGRTTQQSPFKLRDGSSRRGGQRTSQRSEPPANKRYARRKPAPSTGKQQPTRRRAPPPRGRQQQQQPARRAAGPPQRRRAVPPRRGPPPQRRTRAGKPQHQRRGRRYAHDEFDRPSAYPEEEYEDGVYRTFDRPSFGEVMEDLGLRIAEVCIAAAAEEVAGFFAYRRFYPRERRRDYIDPDEY